LPIFRATFFPNSNVGTHDFGKNWLGYILGDFITNSSGHPGVMSAFKSRNNTFP
jgi:hypothetical protein